MKEGGIKYEKSKFIYKVSDSIIREINKRGVVEQKKDSDGIVRKKKSVIGASSVFGLGSVEDTIPTVKKEIDDVRKNLDVYFCQIFIPSAHIVMEPSAKRLKSIEAWHTECSQNLKIGSIGLNPDCYQNNIPPLEEFLETNTGNVLSHFINFIKQKIF